MHPGVFPVKYFTFHKTKAEIADRRVSGDRLIILLQFLHLIFRDLGMKVLHRFGKQVRQVCVLIGSTGTVHTKPGTFHDHFPQNHFRVLNEIAVLSDTVFVGVQMYPVRLDVRHTVFLLQENDVAGDFRAGVALEGIVGQTNGTDEVRPLGKIFADSGIFLVHGSLGGDKGHNTARTHLIQSLAKEIIMDEPVVLVVLFVPNLEISKGYVADGHIKEAVRHLDLFKPIHSNAAVLIELLGNAPGDGVDLHTVGFAVRHALRQHTDKVADAAAWLQEVPLTKSHLLQRLIHGPDNDRRGVKSRQGAGAGSGIFLLIQQRLQLQILAVALIKAVGQTTPAYIPEQYFLFLRGCQTVLSFDLFQATDGGHIGGVFLTGGAVTQLVIRDAKVPAFLCRDLRVQGGEHHSFPFGLRWSKGWCFFFRRFYDLLRYFYRRWTMEMDCIFGFFQCFKPACGGCGNAGLHIVTILVIIPVVGIVLDNNGFII